MEIELQEEGACLFVGEYRLRLSDMKKKVFHVLKTHAHLKPQGISFSLRKGILEVFPDMPLSRLKILSDVIIESCFQMCLVESGESGVEMVFRDDLTDEQSFVNTILVNMKYLKPLKQKATTNESVLKSTKERSRIISQCVNRGDVGESDDMVKFLAYIRKAGMDVIFPQQVHDKVLASILYLMYKKTASPHRDIIDMVMLLANKGLIKPPSRNTERSSGQCDITKTKIRGVLSLLKTSGVLMTDQETTPVGLYLAPDIKTFLDLRRLHDDMLLDHITSGVCSLHKPSVWHEIIWGSSETLNRSRYEEISCFVKTIDMFYLKHEKEESLKKLEEEMSYSSLHPQANADVDVLRSAVSDQVSVSSSNTTHESKAVASPPSYSDRYLEEKSRWQYTRSEFPHGRHPNRDSNKPWVGADHPWKRGYQYEDRQYRYFESRGMVSHEMPPHEFSQSQSQSQSQSYRGPAYSGPPSSYGVSSWPPRYEGSFLHSHEKEIRALNRSSTGHIPDSGQHSLHTTQLLYQNQAMERNTQGADFYRNAVGPSHSTPRDVDGLNVTCSEQEMSSYDDYDAEHRSSTESSLTTLDFRHSDPDVTFDDSDPLSKILNSNINDLFSAFEDGQNEMSWTKLTAEDSKFSLPAVAEEEKDDSKSEPSSPPPGFSSKQS